MEERVKCCLILWTDQHGDKTQCSRWAAYTRDGKAYCRQHDPAELRQRDYEQWIETKRTLSRETAIKLVEAADNVKWAVHHRDALHSAIIEAKRELGI